MEKEEDDKEESRKRENGEDSWAGLLVHAQHRRSKSASERIFNALKGGLSSSTKDQNETDVIVPSTSAPRGQCSLHGNSTYINKNTSTKHRASLEKDIEQLQLRLQQEKSRRIVHESAMGRASSTLSPGHRHVAAQTKELIAEIELLEEEVVNHEQHVLSLYRSIFENCVSRPPSEQKSSMTSPAHPKHESRKHPSIISSAFCSSKNFPFRSLKAIVSIDDSGKRSTKTNHVHLSNGRNDTDSAKCCSGSNKMWSQIKSTTQQKERKKEKKQSSEACLAYGIPNSSLRRLALFYKADCNIGGRVISANAIEQSIFCFRTPRIGWWLETILSAALRKKSGEDRRLSSKFGLPNTQTFVCFALCTGAFSDPVLRVYTASSVREELEEARKEFLQANVVVKKSRKVFLPKMLVRFAREASFGSEALPKSVTTNVDKKLRHSILKCLECKSSKKASQIVDWLPYSSRFWYVLLKDLTEKPWWV